MTLRDGINIIKDSNPSKIKTSNNKKIEGKNNYSNQQDKNNKVNRNSVYTKKRDLNIQLPDEEKSPVQNTNNNNLPNIYK